MYEPKYEPKKSGRYRGNNYNRRNYNNMEEITKIDLPNYLPSYICPKCRLFYEFHATTDGSYIGRVPLVQKCKHTMCSECIRKDFSKQRISCVECNSTSEVQTSDTKKKMHELFPINFYIFGVLMYYRQNNQKTPNLSFRPSGQIWNQEKPGAKCSTASSESNATILSFDREISMEKEKCSQKDCRQDATVNCPECDEIFCDNCATVLHNSAKGLMKHKYTRLLQHVCPELTTTCAAHRGAILEFHCRNCNVNLCCYCVLDKHKDHAYHQLSQMSQEDVITVSGLIQEAEALLAKLERADKKISRHMDENLPNGTSKNNLDVKISRFFENFHASLQILEKQMHDEAIEYKHMRYNSLVMLRKEVIQSIGSISGLINSARRAINKDDEVKLDVQSIKEGLREALTIKCHVMQEDNEVVFEHDAISELQDICRIKYNNINSFVLVNADDIPSSYEDSLSDISSVSLTPSLLNEAASSSRTFSSDQNDTSAGNVSNYLAHCHFPSTGFSKTRSLENRQTPSTNRTKTPLGDICNAPILKIGDKERVTVTHVNSPESFFVHLTRSTYSLMRLNQQIELAKPKRQPFVSQPKMRGIYLVEFKTDSSYQYEGEWYRARITHMSVAEDKYTVFYIDYGNTAIVPKKWIKPLPDGLERTPPLAIECKIYDIFPNRQEWDQESTKLIVSIVKDIEVLMIILDKTLVGLEVDLITMDGDTSVRDALMFIGAGNLHIQGHPDIKKVKEDMSCSFKKHTMYPFSKQFVKYEEVEVVIASVQDPHHVYLNLVEHQEIMKDLKKSMKTHYTQNLKGFLYAPKENMPVAVQMTPGNWYRGILVTTSDQRKQMEVYLVDVGSTSCVEWSNMRKLDDKFMHVQCQAFCVKLMHVKPVNGGAWSNEVKQFFTPYIDGNVVLKMIVGEIWLAGEILDVALFEAQQSVHYCVNAKLVRNGFAEADGQLGAEVEWPQCEEMSTQNTFTLQMMKWSQNNQQETTQDSGDEDYSALIRKEVDIVSIVDPSCIYVRFTMMSPNQAKFYAELQEFYSAINHVPLSWTSDKVVVKRDNQYHRGIIRGREDGLYNVELKDLGEVIKADGGSIYHLEEYFANFPEFVTKCHLANITPAGDSSKWSRLASDFLTETLKGKSKILVTKCGKIDMERCSMPVVMWYTEFLPGGPLQRSKTILHCLNKMLVSNGLALKTHVQLVFPKCETPTPIKHRGEEDNTPIKNIGEEGATPIKTEGEEDITPVAFVARDANITSWLPSPPFRHDKIIGTATYVDEHANIYFQDNRNKASLELMEAEINKFCEGAKYVPYDWQVGDLCLARYHVDNSWYRAQITDRKTLKVVMIDYGNEEEIDKVQDLNHRIIHYDVPSFAHRVCLDNIRPKIAPWSTSDLDMLHGAIVSQKIEVVLIDKTATPPTANIKCQKVDINKFMLEKSVNLQTMSQREESDDSEDVIIIEDESYEVSKELKEPPQYKQRQLPSATPLQKLINVKAINIRTYREFVLDFGLHAEEKDASDKLNELHLEINDHSLEQPIISNLETGMPCIALFAEDQLYYRGVVREILDDNVVVYFVDYGNTDVVCKENVREIKREWAYRYPLDYLIASVPIEAVNPDRCDLLDNFMRKDVVPQVAFASIVRFEPLTVRLFTKDRKAQAYQSLIDLSLVKECDDA